MSFTSDTKQELLTLPMNDCCRIAELSALFAINGHLSISSEGVALVFQTTSLPLARKVIVSLKRLYKISVDVLSKKQVKLKKKNQYSVIVREKVHSIINELSLMDEDKGYAQTLDETLIIKECDKRAYLRGAFLASGSINHPNSSSYHAELTIPSMGLAEDIMDLMNTFDLNTKYITKKKNYLVYIKESEKIADFLRIVDATNALFTFEDERIKRDFVNSITRVMNMEIANQNKTLDAANKQLKHIAILENLVDMNKLPETLHEAIFLRKTYPEASLNELSEFSKDHFNKPISKSGLNHRYRNISALAMEVLDDFNE